MKIWQLLSLIILLSTGCLYAKTETLSVLGSFPQSGENQVPLKVVVEVNLNKGLKARSINMFTITLNDGRSDVSGSIHLDSSKTKIIFTPYSELIPDRLYTFKTDKNIEDIDGMKLQKDFVFTFRTISVDVIRPSIVSVFPLNGSLDTDIHENIEIQVSEPLKLSSVNTRSVKLLENDVPVPGKIKFIRETSKIVFFPEKKLAYNTHYKVFVSRSLQDMSGNLLPGDVQWSFTTRSEPDTQPPRVVSVFPADGKDDVQIDSRIAVVFDEPLKAEDVNCFSFILRNSRSNIACSVEYEEKIHTVYLIPVQSLSYGESYQVKIFSGIRDRFDNNSKKDFTFSFKTITEPDRSAPQVTQFFPEDLSEGVSLEVHPKAYFDEELKDMTVNPLSVILYCGYRKINGKVVYHSQERCVEFIPESKLLYDKKYLFVIKRDVSDIAGNSLMSEKVTSFTTTTPPDKTGPSVVFSSPAVGEKNIPVDKKITVFFNEPVNPVSCNLGNIRIFSIKDKKILKGKIRYEYTDNRVVLDLDENMKYDTVYRIQVKNIIDVHQNILFKEVEWDFTTIPAPDKKSPGIVSSFPVDGSGAIDVFSQFYAIFDEPLNPATVNSYSVLINDGKNDVQTQVSYDLVYNKIVVIPEDRLEFEKMYFLIFQTSLADKSGNRLKKPVILKFMTDKKPDVQPPEVIKFQPGNSENRVDVTTNIRVDFSEEIDENTLNNYTFQVKTVSDQKEIKGKILYDSLYSRGVFVPEKRLQFGTLYQVEVKKGILDLEGNPMRKDTQWEFLTIHEDKLQSMPLGEAFTWIEEEPFPDLKREHWAFNTVKELKRKGYMKDYPMEGFYGDRAISRFEFALFVERLVRSLENREQLDLYDRMLIEKLLVNFSAEIKTLGGDLTELKNTLQQRKQEITRQEKRTDDLETRVDYFKRTVFSRIRRKKMTALMMMALLAAF